MLFLGVDGGQSGTTAIIGGENGLILGLGSAGPANHAGTAEGRSRLKAAVLESVGAACARAGLDLAAARFRVACLGLSGGPEDKQDILAEILKAERLLLTTDAEVALSGATCGKPGAITIAGTGSIAFGRNAAGRTARAGGWGYVFGDEGGALDIVRQALRAALRAEEGWGPATVLAGALREATGALSVNQAMHLFYGEAWPRARVAALAPLVDRAADSGDDAAQDILRNAASELAALTRAVWRQLWSGGEDACLCYAGGVFRSRVLLDHYRTLVEEEIGIRPAAPVYPPAAGALIEAYRAAGLAPRLAGLPEVEHAT